MNNKITPEDLEPISMEDFEEAFKKVMLKRPPAKSMYENRRPTKKELEIKWKLKSGMLNNFRGFKYIVP